jgi:ATP-binding protein involved in chromosome partitioning
MMAHKEALPGIKFTLAVASGKGGVGKTTVTVNLALALQAQGAAVGIFDADIFGPNVPLMLGIHRRRPGGGYVPTLRARGSEPYLPPVERYGLKIMSIGLVMAEDQVINPLAEVAGQVVVETLRSVQWGRLDYLLIDLPPSAGQPQQGLLENVLMSGVLIVTTPQDLSLLDSSRSLMLYRNAGAPVVGLVENMSYFVCPTCGGRHEIFQASEHWRVEALQDVPLLGRIPLSPDISRRVDRKHPLIVDSAPGSNPVGAEAVKAQAFLDIARSVQVGLQAARADRERAHGRRSEGGEDDQPIGSGGTA